MTRLQRIDAHQHFWDPGRAEYPWLTVELAAIARTFGPEDLGTELERLRVDGTIVVSALPSTAETRWLLGMADSTPWIVGVVGWVDLIADDVPAAIASLRSGPGGDYLVGVRHSVGDEVDADWLTRADVRRGLAEVAAAGLAVDVLVDNRELPAVLEVCRALPQLRLVLDHLARPPIASGDLSEWGRAILPLAEEPNIFAGVAGLATEADWQAWSIDDLRHPIELAIDAFGPERLMLGSDWPVCLLAGSYADVIDATRYLLADLPAHEQAEIEGGTAQRVYRLARARSDRKPAGL